MMCIILIGVLISLETLIRFCQPGTPMLYNIISQHLYLVYLETVPLTRSQAQTIFPRQSIYIMGIFTFDLRMCVLILSRLSMNA